LTNCQTAEPGTLLAIERLTVAFPAGRRSDLPGWTEVVREASLTVGEREVVGLVGESGSGKTLTALAALRLVPEPGRITGGSVRFAGEEVLELNERELRRLR
jgi:ABC-type glutathione transport system ATPase component